MNPFDQFDRTLPFKNKPYVDDLGVNPMDENDVYSAIGGNPFDQFDSQKTAAPQESFGPVQGPIQAPYKKEGLGRTAFDQGMQGATFGFSDDISDRLGAVSAALMREPKALITGEFTDPELINEVAGARDSTEARLSKQIKDRPFTSIASNIAGGLLTGAAGATTRVGSTIGNFSRTGNILSRVAKGAAIGSASGGFYGAGVGKDGEKAESAGRGALLGGAVGAAAPLATSLIGGTAKGTKNLAQGVLARNEGQLEEAGNAIKSVSSKAYQKMRDIGAEFTPQARQNIVSKIEQTLNADGPLNQGLHGATMSVLSDLKKAAGYSDFSLEQLDQWRRLLSRVPRTNPEDARKAGIVVDALDDAVDALSAKDLIKGSADAIGALNLGRQEYARFSKFDKISQVLKRADGDPNKIKSGLRSFLNNKKNIRGFSPAEIVELQNAARYSAPEGLMKALGKFGFDLGTSQTVGNTALPVISGVLTGGKLTAAGTAARQGQKYLARGKAENLLKLIEQGQVPSVSMINKLPPKEAQKVLAALNASKIAAPGAAVIQTKK